MSLNRIELPVQGMDCAECTRHVQRAIAGLPGVEQVDVFLAAEKAVVAYDTQQVDLPTIRRAVRAAGYQAEDLTDEDALRAAQSGAAMAQRAFWALGLVVGAVLVIVVVGEWLGLFDAMTARTDHRGVALGGVGRLSGLSQCAAGRAAAASHVTYIDDRGRDRGVGRG